VIEGATQAWWEGRCTMTRGWMTAGSADSLWFGFLLRDGVRMELSSGVDVLDTIQQCNGSVFESSLQQGMELG
jgi:hypothetical protein